MGSCIGSCVATCACEACAKAFNCAGSRSNPRVPYLILLFFSIILTMILQAVLQANQLFSLFGVIDITLCTSDTCLGNLLVYRISFALFCLFALLAFCSLFKECLVFHTGMWLCKLIFFLVLLICAFFIPNDVFVVYAQIARPVAGLFLLIQILICIDFIYTIHERMKEAEQYQRILALAGTCYVLSIVGIALLYVYYSTGCSIHTFFITVTLIMGIMYSFLSIYCVHEHGGILPASIVMFYTTYVLYSALSSNPSDTCNSYMNSPQTFQKVIGLVIAGFSITYATWSVSSTVASEVAHASPEKPSGTELKGGSGDAKDAKDTSKDVKESKESKESKDLKEVKEVKKDDWTKVELKGSHDDEIDDKGPGGSVALFHFIMMCASMYTCMLLTNWASPSAEDNQVYGVSLTSMWIKIVSEWIVILVYLWTLVAPVVLANREFGRV